jgi:M penetrans paralogue family 26
MEQQSTLYPPNRNQPANLPNATASLVLGIIAIVGSFCYIIPGLVCGIIGLVLANKDRHLYQATPELYAQASYSQSNAGRVCSLIGIILAGVLLVIGIIYFVVFGSLIWGASRGYSY